MQQMLMAIFGLTAMWIGLGPADHPLRPWAPVIGLAGQPFWFALAWKAHHKGVDVRGLGFLCVAWTLVYVRGILVQWA
jgi:hypothetical protein